MRPRPFYERFRSGIRDVARTISASYEIVTRHRGVSALGRLGGRLVADVQTPGGALFVHLLDLGVGRPLYTGKEYEPEETALLQQTLKPGMTVVDVGANVGYMALVSARSIGPTGRVLAIEPDASNVELLAANISRNGYRNVTVCQCAVGSEPGTATLYRSAWNMGNHRLNAGDAGKAIAEQAVQVEVETVDRLVTRHGLGHVDFIKMDVEGYEPGVLAGLRETLARDRPMILTEFWPHGIRDAGFDPAAFLDTCLRAGYEARAIGQPHRPLRAVDAILETLPDQGPGTYENLFFVPMSS